MTDGVQPPDDGNRNTNLYDTMASIFVPHQNFVDAETRVLDVLSLHGRSRAIPCLEVSGPAGTGKTTLWEQLRQRFPIVPAGCQVRVKPGYPPMVADRVPLLTIEMPPEPTRVSMAMEMLHGYKDPAWDKGKPIELDKRLDGYIEDSGTKGILVDEAQRAVDRNGTVVSYHLMDWFKSRHRNTGVCIILLGLGRLRYLFEQDDQFDRRFYAPLRMRPYRWAVYVDGQLKEFPEEQDQFIGLLVAFRNAFQNASSLKFVMDVEDYDVAHRFFYASSGVVGRYAILMETAAWLGEKRGCRAIDMPLLAEAFEIAIRKEVHGLINPFDDRQWDKRLPPALDDDTELLRPKELRKKKGKTRKQRNRDVIDRLSKR